MEPTVINFKKTDGPITLEISPGYCAFGSFILAYRNKDMGEEYIEFGNSPKRIDDEREDIYLIPINEEKIENYRVVIIGKYKPAEEHNQIKVNYMLRQGDKLIGESKIQETLDDSEQFMRFSSKFEFIKIDGD